MEKEWLQKQITIGQAEQKHLVVHADLGPNPVVFGFIHKEWLIFKAKIKQDDQLWEFSSVDRFWNSLAGRAGLCIVRDGEVVDSFVIEMS